MGGWIRLVGFFKRLLVVLLEVEGISSAGVKWRG